MRGYEAGRADALKELQSAHANAVPDKPLEDSGASSIGNTGDSHPATAVKRRAVLTPSDGPFDAEVASLRIPEAAGPNSLRGSLESLERQNATLEAEGLERILDERDLASRITHGLLVPLPASAELTVNPSLTPNHRYCRPWTAHFLSDLARAHGAQFHRPFEINSAVRTVEYQKRLMRTNGNAAAAEGDVVSPHLTGATIDIGKQGMSRAELDWMRSHLLAIQQTGKIDVEEEFEQACFHITVYNTYGSSMPHRPVQPAMREAAAPRKAAPVPRSSSLPSSLAVGVLGTRAR